MGWQNVAFSLDVCNRDLGRGICYLPDAEFISGLVVGITRACKACIGRV